MQKVKTNMQLKAEWVITKFRGLNPKEETLLKYGAPIEQFASRIYATERARPDILFTINRQLFEHFRQMQIGLNEGLAELIDIIIGAGTPVKWDNTNAYIGVGDSNTAANSSQTGLLAVTNKLYKAMDATYPQRTSQTASWRSTFGSADANWAWEEYTVSNTNSDSGKNLVRKVESKGTKASGETWVLTLSIAFS